VINKHDNGNMVKVVNLKINLAPAPFQWKVVITQDRPEGQ